MAKLPVIAIACPNGLMPALGTPCTWHEWRHRHVIPTRLHCTAVLLMNIPLPHCFFLKLMCPCPPRPA